MEERIGSFGLYLELMRRIHDLFHGLSFYIHHTKRLHMFLHWCVLNLLHGSRGSRLSYKISWNLIEAIVSCCKSAVRTISKLNFSHPLIVTFLFNAKREQNEYTFFAMLNLIECICQFCMVLQKFRMRELWVQ